MASKLNVDLSQFSNLDFNDVGAWPVAVKAVAICLLCVAVAGAGYWFVIQQQLEELEAARDKEQDLLATFETKQRKAANLEAYRQQMVEMENSFGAMLRQLPSETEVAELLVDVSQAGLANGLEFNTFRPGGENPAEFYAELPISISVSGDYHQFAQFTSDVAELSRIVTLHDISMSGTEGRLTVGATAKTYRYMEKK